MYGLNRHSLASREFMALKWFAKPPSLTDKVTMPILAKPVLQATAPTALFGAGHVGTRPAIKQAHPEWRLEVHFPNVSADLYGLLMRVTFLNYLHGEKDYPSLEALKAGIDDDVEKLLEFRQDHPNISLLIYPIFYCKTCQSID